MIVAFLLVGEQQRPLAERMVASVRRVMRTVPIVQMRDEQTPEVEGIFCSKVLPWDGRNLMTYRLLHLALLPRQDVLILDTDTIVQQDVRRVFHNKFDVALTKREGPILDPNGNDLAKLMPFNSGVMFSKSVAFWRECHEWCAKASPELQTWYGDQMAIKTIVGEGQFDLMELPVNPYNYSPSHVDEDVSDKVIVHYKGNRKAWMLDKWPSPTTPR